MIGLTPKQAELLAFIRRFFVEHRGVSPSFDEMRTGVGLKSKSGISRLVDGLVHRGAIRRVVERSRSIEIVEQVDAVAAERERCAKIADDYVAQCQRGSAVSSMAEDAWGAQAGREIAKAIRGTA